MGKDAVEPGNLKHVLHGTVSIRDLDAAALRAQLFGRDHQRAQTRAIEEGNVLEIQQQLGIAFFGQLADGIADEISASARSDASRQIKYSDGPELAGADFEAHTGKVCTLLATYANGQKGSWEFWLPICSVRYVQDIQKAAREKLGLDSLRAGQEEAVRSVLEGRDTLVIQPTGSGKSAIYQIAGLMRKGTTVVVSPLLALQRDQLDAIAAQPHGERAAAVNSTLSEGDCRDVLRDLAAGKVKYLFLAPEQLRNDDVAAALGGARVSLFAVDEAHCVSEWGHDFRPDYLRLGETIERMGHPVTLALTATASRAVREDIVSRLKMRDPKVLVSGFDRPNIRLRVDRFDTEEAKLAALAHMVRWAEKPGIVYVATRSNAEMVMRALRDEGTDAVFYHAGLKSKDREKIQQRFMSGDAEVIVATSAFGMGVDKADVRFVYHYDLPESLDAYYQEVGRAGRDGKAAEAILFYRAQNAGLRRFQAGTGKFDEGDVNRVLDALESGADAAPPEGTGGGKRSEVILRALIEAGAVEEHEGKYMAVPGIDRAAIAREVAGNRSLYLERRKQRLQQMQSYAQVTTCRREFLLRYFDDEWGACVNCDNCAAGSAFLPPELSGGTRREVSGP